MCLGLGGGRQVGFGLSYRTLTTQLVRTLVGGSRLAMLSSLMCFMWRGGWRFLVRISLVLA